MRSKILLLKAVGCTDAEVADKMDVGQSAELRYLASFACYVREVAEAQGHPRMATVSDFTLSWSFASTAATS